LPLFSVTLIVVEIILISTSGQEHSVLIGASGMLGGVVIGAWFISRFVDAGEGRDGSDAVDERPAWSAVSAVLGLVLVLLAVAPSVLLGLASTGVGFGLSIAVAGFRRGAGE
jgi:hypothetical protein